MIPIAIGESNYTKPFIKKKKADNRLLIMESSHPWGKLFLPTTDRVTMSGGQATLGPESPAASGKLPLGRRKSGMRLELLEPNEEDDLTEQWASGSRRPSTCSLSRFRSCPQLAAAAHDQISPGIEIVDIDDDCAASSSPPIGHRRLQIDDLDRCPATPTPPSTPGSRRSHMSLKESCQSNRISGLSPSSTPKLSRRSKRDFKLMGRTSSGDSGPQDHMSFSSTGVQISVRDDSIARFDGFSDRLSRPEAGIPGLNFDETLSDHVDDDRHHHHHQQQHSHAHHAVGDDSHDKCQRWLQSLKITRADRIKSRSHIQLPPI